MSDLADARLALFRDEDRVQYVQIVLEAMERKRMAPPIRHSIRRV